MSKQNRSQGSQLSQSQSQSGQRQQRGQQQQSQDQEGQQGQQAQGNQPADIQSEILNAVTPAFQEARRYIESSPVAAAAIGAIAGGAIMTLFSTEKGRAFARAAYDYANPMVAKYAREYISKAAGDMAEKSISQH